MAPPVCPGAGVLAAGLAVPPSFPSFFVVRGKCGEILQEHPGLTVAAYCGL